MTLDLPVDTGRRALSDLLLRPRSIAIIGASDNPEALGGRPVGFLRNYGYTGGIYPVNANRDVVQDVPAYRSVSDIPDRVDLALVMVRAELVPDVLRECAEAGVGAAAIVSSGFGEGMGGGAQLAETVAAIVSETGMRVLGPNCEGLASLPVSAPVTFSPVLDIHRTGKTLTRGSIAVISQSGGLGFAVAGWGSEVGLGFSYIVSTGNELDVDCVEIASALVDDEDTTAVVLIVESVREFDGLVELASRLRAAGKKLVLAKLASSEAGARGAFAHTRHIVDPAEHYHDRLHELGVFAAGSMDEIVDVLQGITKADPARGSRIGILTTSGGAGVWLADAASATGFVVPELSEKTRSALIELMPGYGSPINPVDLTAQFLAGGSFVPPIRTLAESGEVDVVVLATSLSSSGRLAGDRLELGRLIAESPVPIAIYSYTKPAASTVEILNELGVPWFTDSSRAARGVAALIPRS